jgi:anti-sigma regulatory factor (Ser/Thr protein kinase)
MEENLILEMKLPKISDIELVAVAGLEKMGVFFGIPEGKIGEAKVAVIEAIINAFEHGGGERANVHIEFIMSKEKLTILVTDEGKGFNPDEIEEPNIKDKIGSDYKRGWGLKLMESMSDDLIVESRESGTKITIIKNLL